MTSPSYRRWQSTPSLLLVAMLAVFADRTWHWPLVGDAAVMHYDVFMMAHGFAPWRDLVDPNMPGTFLIEGAVVHLFGGGDLTWRLFDLLLLACVGAAMILISLPYDWFAGVLAASLFALIHARDGVIQLGQRDLIMTVFLLWACAFFFLAVRPDRERSSPWLMGLFGLSIGFAGIVKPTAFLWALVLLPLMAVTLRRQRRPFWPRIAFASLGMASPCALALRFILRWHAWSAFLHTLISLIPALNLLERRSVPHLLWHSISAIVLPLFILWIAVICLAKIPWTLERFVLLAGVMLGLISFYVQRKGYPYHRYPSEAFLLLLMSIDFTSLLKRGRGPHPAPYRFAGCAIVVGIFVVGGGSLLHALGQDRHNQEFDSMLRADLTRLGGDRLAGQVQCLDSWNGCIPALYNMRLVQATGFIYDCYLFSPDIDSATEDRYRDRFWQSIRNHPPQVFVVGSDECGGDSSLYQYRKLDRWPLFNSLLSTDYRLYAQRLPPHMVNWGSSPSRPLGYRIYVRNR